MRSTILLAALAVGCGSSEDSAPAVNTSPDAAAEVSTDAVSTDAADVATDAATDTPASCDLGTLPTVAPFSAEFVLIDPDAGVTVPAPTGGDPTGQWRYSKITIYLKPEAKSVLDISKSSIEGSGFASYTATSFVNTTEQKVTLETTVVGTVKRGSSLKAKGTWKLEGNEIVYTADCREVSGESSVSRVGWSRISADEARLQFKPPPSGAGDYNEQIVIDLELVK